MGGFNDQMCRIQRGIEYCRKTKRTLLIDTTKSCYNINFSDYFYFKNPSIPIITDMNIIQKIVKNESLTVYPNIKNRDITSWKLNCTSSGIRELEKFLLNLPEGNCDENIILYSSCGGGNGLTIFKELFFKQNIIDHVKSEVSKLPKKYLCIQIRNTDRSCDYKGLYETNKSLVHSYDTIYIATDDKTSIDFFKSKGLNIVNFTEFPSETIPNLHYSNISGDTKIKNLITDIYIISMADKLLSNSVGGFIQLVKEIRGDIPMLLAKFN